MNFPEAFQPLSRRKEKLIVIRILTCILAATLPGGTQLHPRVNEPRITQRVYATSLKSPFCFFPYGTTIEYPILAWWYSLMYNYKL